MLGPHDALTVSTALPGRCEDRTAEQAATRRRFGVLFQSGALMSSMTLAENIALTLGEYTDLKPREIRELASLKLALVGLAGFAELALKGTVPRRLRSSRTRTRRRSWRGRRAG